MLGSMFIMCDVCLHLKVFVDLSPLFKVWFVFDAERDKDC